MDHCNGHQPCGKTSGTVDGKEVVFPAGDQETAGFLPAMLEKSADTDLLILVEREGFLRNFTNLFYRLFLLLFCRIKVPTVHTPVQIWESSILKQIPPEKRTCFPENMVLAKMACPQLRISVFFSGRRSPLPTGNPFIFMVKEFFALYRLACVRLTWLHQLVLYGIIGLLAAAVDYGIFALLTFFDFLPPEFASLAGNIAGFFFTFSGNTFYNFKKSDHVLFRFISYLTIAACGMAFSTLIIRFSQNFFNVYLIKAALTLFIIPLIQFILNKKITYRQFKK